MKSNQRSVELAVIAGMGSDRWTENWRSVDTAENKISDSIADIAYYPPVSTRHRLMYPVGTKDYY